MAAEDDLGLRWGGDPLAPACPGCGAVGWQPEDGPPPYSADGEELGEDHWWCSACECWFEGSP